VEHDPGLDPVDPGPKVDRHVNAVLEAVGPYTTVGVAATHAHPDHTPAANILAAALGVQVMAFAIGPSLRPDRLLADGDEIEVGSARVIAVHTPGHSPDHLSYRVAAAMFTGDHIINAPSALVENVPEYLDALHRLQESGLRILFPGHGNPMRDPEAVLRAQIAGVRDREEKVLAALDGGARSVGEIVARVYPGLDRTLFFSAAENIGAHLRKLSDDGLVALPEGAVEWSARVHLVDAAPEEE